MPDAIQFSVTKLDVNTYRVVVQGRDTILQSSDIRAKDIMHKLEYELAQLKPAK